MSMNTTKDPNQIDAESRNRIIGETDSNFFVEAGAGSGKTTMLVNRMVAMVESGKDISEICAITFTKAAAGEFYDRFQEVLINRSNPSYVYKSNGYAGELPKPTPETMKLCEQALAHIDLCFMGTIDSFCNMILSEHPSEAGISSNASLVSDEEMGSIIKKVYVDVCHGKYNGSIPKLQVLADDFRQFHNSPQEVIDKGLRFVMGRRDAQFQYTPYRHVDIDTAYASIKAEILAALPLLISHPGIAHTSDNNLRVWSELPDILNGLNCVWSRNIPSVIYHLSRIEKLQFAIKPSTIGLAYGQLIRDTTPKGRRTWVAEFTLGDDDMVYHELENLRHSLSMEFICTLIPIIEKVMLEKGGMTYFDYLYYLRNTLKEDASGTGKLIKYISERHKYFLIDEFQDTNPLQSEVFFYLAADKLDKDWSMCIPRPGSLFIVGDPKQSIYRFRSADVNSYLKVKGLFELPSGEVLNLPKNFRSEKKLIEYFNRIFTGMFPDASQKGADKHPENKGLFTQIPVPTAGNSGDFTGVYTYLGDTSKKPDTIPDMVDELKIAYMIQMLTEKDDAGNPKYTIADSKTGVSRGIEYKDIMVITMAKGYLGILMNYLYSKGIPTKTEGKVPFENNEALKAISDVYAAISNVRDKKSLYKVLTGNIYGYSEADLILYGSVSLRQNKIEEQELPKDALGKTLDTLRELSTKVSGLSPAALFEVIMDEVEIYTRYEAENLEVVYYTLELLRNGEKDGTIVTCKDASAFLNNLVTGHSDEERCLRLTTNDNRVHMANLHKVKGLEAPVVILAYAYNHSSGQDYRIVRNGNETKGYIFSLKPEAEAGEHKRPYFRTFDYEDEAKDEKTASSEEKDRLMYVAATRARSALIICEVWSAGLSYTKWKGLIESDTKLLLDRDNKEKEAIALAKQKAEQEVEGGCGAGWSQEELAKRLKQTLIVPVRKRESDITVKASELYDEAEKTSVLINRETSESPTYKSVTPSHLKKHPSLSDMIDEEGTSELGRNLLPVIEINDSDNGDYKEIPDLDPKIGRIAHKHATTLGTMVHRMMEIIVVSKDRVKKDALVENLLNQYLAPNMEPDKESLREALSFVYEKIHNGGFEQSFGLPKDILPVLLGADEVHCEWGITYRTMEDGMCAIVNGNIDVLYCNNGEWHIIDYKTNAEGTDLDKKYAGQLNEYANAVERALGTRPDAKIYYINI